MKSFFAKIAFPVSVLFVFGLSFLVRSLQIGVRPLEYDELWTVQHYLKIPLLQVFTDVATPNNHSLNSLLIRISTELFGTSFFTIRLPALIFGCLTLFLMLYLLWKVFGLNRFLALLGVFAVGIVEVMIRYSATARGYSMQTFFILLFFCGLVLVRQNRKSFSACLILLISAAGACLSVPSGILFIASMSLTYFLLFFDLRHPGREFRENRFLLIAGGLFFLAAPVWYGSHYQAFRAAQQFGTPLNSFSAFFTFCLQVLTELKLLPFLSALPVLFCFHLCSTPRWKWTLFPWIVLVFLLVSALLSKGGPARVYQGIVPLLIFSLILGVYEAIEWRRARSLKNAALPALLVLGIMGLTGLALPATAVFPPAPSSLALQMARELPSGRIYLFPAPDTYPIRFNAPEVRLDLMNRMKSPLNGVVQVNSSGMLSVADRRGNLFPVPMDRYAVNSYTDSRKNTFDCYDWTPLTADSPLSPGDLLALTLAPVPAGRRGELLNFLEERETWYFSNLFLNDPVPDGAEGVNSGLLVRPAPVRPAREYFDYAKGYNGALRFYRFVPKK